MLMSSARRRRIEPTIPSARPAPSPLAARLPSLDGVRVQLRWLEGHDVEAIYSVFSDPEVMRYWSRPPFESRDDAHIYLESIHRGFERGDLMQWGIGRQASGDVIGTATLASIDLAQGRAEVGIALSKEHWGQGYAREALTLLLDYAFNQLGLRRLEADVDPRNLGSLRALEALGFKREGYLRQRWQVAGEIQDSMLLGLLKLEWQAQSVSLPMR